MSKDCVHNYVRDQDAPRHFACQECGDVVDEAGYEKYKAQRVQEQNTVYGLIQEGGSCKELYVHAWTTKDDAEQDRVNCTDDGSYRTSPVIAIPKSLSEHPDFYNVLEQFLIASHELSYAYNCRVSLHEDKGDKVTIMFDCVATDKDDAEEQALKEYPNAEIVNILRIEDDE